MDFKNSFAWLTDMKKLIFQYNNFFGSGHFLVYFSRPHGSKNDRSQKSYFDKKSVFSCLSTSWSNFLFLFMLWLYFHDWSPKLYEARAKLCYLGGQSFLDQNLFFCLCLPPVWCSKRLLKYGLTLLIIYLPIYDIYGT